MQVFSVLLDELYILRKYQISSHVAGRYFNLELPAAKKEEVKQEEEEEK